MCHNRARCSGDILPRNERSIEPFTQIQFTPARAPDESSSTTRRYRMLFSFIGFAAACGRSPEHSLDYCRRYEPDAGLLRGRVRDNTAHRSSCAGKCSIHEGIRDNAGLLTCQVHADHGLLRDLAGHVPDAIGVSNSRFDAWLPGVVARRIVLHHEQRKNRLQHEQL